MATVGTIVANLVANTTKFTNGFKKAKESIHSVQAQMTGLDRVVKVQQERFAKLGGTVSAALDAELERAKQRKAIALKTEVVVGQARIKAMQNAERALAAARFHEIRQSEMRALRLRQFYARQQEQVMQGPMFGKRFIGAGKKAFGSLGLAAGLAGDSFGDSGTGRAMGAIGSIAGQASLGGIAAGPWGAAIFGSIAALKEFKAELDRTAESVTAARDAGIQNVENFLARRGDVVGAARGIREQFFPDLATEKDARKQLVERAKEAKRLLNQARNREGGFDANDALKFQTEWQQILEERVKFDQQRRFRDTGAQGLVAMFQSRTQLLEGAKQIAANALGQVNAGVLGVRGAFLEGQIARRREEEQDVASRVASLMSGDKSALGAPLAIKGTNDFLKAIHDQPKVEHKLADLVKIAKQQLAEEKKQADDIAREIARQRVTVRM